jgi:APA family basic amino acid/polyamine antiporter
MGMIPAAQLESAQFPFAIAGNILFGSQSAVIIALCAVISGLGALNVTILIQGQIVFAAARDRLFPQRFSKLSKRDVPVAGQILSSTLVTILMIVTLQPTLLEQFDNIALLAGLFTLLTYLASAMSELRFLIRDHGISKALFRNKSLPISIIAVTYCTWMISNFTMPFLLTGLVSIIIFAGLYSLIFHKHVL